MVRFGDYHPKPDRRAKDWSGGQSQYLEATAKLWNFIWKKLYFSRKQNGFWCTEPLKTEIKWGLYPCDSSPHCQFHMSHRCETMYQKIFKANGLFTRKHIFYPGQYLSLQCTFPQLPLDELAQLCELSANMRFNIYYLWIMTWDKYLEERLWGKKPFEKLLFISTPTTHLARPWAQRTCNYRAAIRTAHTCWTVLKCRTLCGLLFVFNPEH